MESKNIISSNIEKLKNLFPNVITTTDEGEKINWEIFKQEFSEQIVSESKEKYELTWPGKRKSILTGNQKTNNTLRPLKEKSLNFDDTKNIYIEGDNLEVLKILQESYLNKIKCIYIDPPYNTGNDFIYNDDYSKDRMQELEDSGQIDEYGNTYPSGETTITVKTRKMPLKINDRTVGDGFHQFNYDKNWTPTVSSKKVHDAPAYNGDVTVSKAGVSTATVKFKGHTVVLYGVRTDRNNLIKVYVDGVLKRELTKDTPFGFDSMVYYDETLTDGEHTLRIEADATFSLDRMDVFGKTFEDVTEAPEKVTEVDVLPTTNLISLKWVAPEHSAGIQYYRILTTLPEEQRIDTVYSPEFTISELQENTAYTVTIEAYDPCGNKSVSDEMQFSTVVKQCVEIAKLKGSIVVDGVADEEGWLAAQSLEITNSSTAVPDRNDLNGWFKVLWSQRYLYLYIDVTDDVKVARTDELSDLGEHDGFELYLDGNNKKTGPYSLEDAYVKALYSPVQYEEYNNVTTMVYGVSETEHGYGVEIRYNLADLRMVPGEVGKELGLDIHLNDNDKLGSYGLDNKLTWQRGSENAALNKAMLGNMVFVEEVSGLGLVNRVESLSVHPNPVVDLLNVSVSEAEFNVVIYNSQGKRLAEYKNQCQIDMTEYAAGVYMVQVIAQDKMYNAKIMKK